MSRWRDAFAFLAAVSLLHSLSPAHSHECRGLRFAPRSMLRSAASPTHQSAPAAPLAAAAVAPAAPPRRCADEEAPRYRAFIDREYGEFRKRAEYSLCTECAGFVVDSWAAAIARGAAQSPRVVLDIGGNRGNAATAFLRAFAAPTVVRSFELDQGTCAELRERRDGHEPESERVRWHVTCEGVAAREDTMDFFTGGVGSPLSGLGQLVTPSEKLKLGGRANVTTVKAIRARHALSSVGFVKIDVEGWEREVLEGMDLEADAAAFDSILFEYGATWADTRKGPSNRSLAEVVAWLSDVGDAGLSAGLSDAGDAGFACFFAGSRDLVPISPPFLPPAPADIDMSPNVLCLRRGAPIHAQLLAAHRHEVVHCPAGSETAQAAR